MDILIIADIIITKYSALKALFGRGEGFEKHSGHSGWWNSSSTQPLLLCKGVTMFAPLTHLPHCWHTCTLHQQSIGAPALGRYLWISSLRLGSGCSQVAAAFPYHTIATCPCLPHHHQNEDFKNFWARSNVHSSRKQFLPHR